MAAKDKWLLSQIVIRSFLGVGQSGVTVDLDRDVIVLLGSSGSGKSTIVSAIEWAIFGKIEPLPDYNVAGVGENRSTYRSIIHDGESSAEVTLTFKKGDSTLVWKRLRNRGTPRPGEDEISCHIDSVVVKADTESIFGLTLSLYTRGVAPRQTTIRNLVHYEKVDRNEALDHLFGIESLNSLSVGFSRGRLGIRHRVEDLVARYDALSGRLRDPVRGQFEKRTRARQACIDDGFSRDHLTQRIAHEAVREICLSLGDKTPADPVTVKAMQTRIESLREKADRTWISPGPQERMKRLTDVYNRVSPARSNWQKTVEAERTAREELEEVVKETGDEKEVATAVFEASEKLLTAEASLADANREASVLVQAKVWFDEHDHGLDLACPVCQRGIDAAVLSSAIDTSLQTLNGSDGTIVHLQSEIKLARDTKNLSERNLAKFTAAVQKAESSAATALDGRNATLELVFAIANTWKAVQQLDEQETAVFGILQSISEISPEAEDADSKFEPLLRGLISEATKARNETTKELEQASDDANKIRTRIISTQRLLEFLQEDEILSGMDVVLSNTSLGLASSEIAAAKRMEATVETLADVAGEISETEAIKITEALSKPLSVWFGRISQHDLLKGAIVTSKVRKAGGIVRNTYEIRATDASGLNPVPAGHNLSGGYEMVLAVSALCAIQEQVSLSHSLGLFILDEPTESLDPELAEAMGKSLGLHAPGPRTVITTNQPNFAMAIQKSAGAARAKLINLGRWTVSNGTRIEQVKG